MSFVHLGLFVTATSAILPSIPAATDIPQAIITNSSAPTATKLTLSNKKDLKVNFASYSVSSNADKANVFSKQLEIFEKKENQRKEEEEEQKKQEALRIAREKLRQLSKPVVAQSVSSESPAKPIEVAKPAIVAPTPVSSSGSIEDLIRQKCAQYGCNPAQLIRVMYCESGGNPSAANPSGATGLFQHMKQYWPTRAASVGLAGASIYDVNAQVTVTAQMFASGQASAWSCK